MHACPPRKIDSDLTEVLERYRAAGFDAVTINVADSFWTLEDAIRTTASFRRQIAAHRDRYMLVRTIEDLRTARSSGKLAVSFDVEGALSIGDQLDVVDLYYELGVRWMAFVYNRQNLVGSGVHDDPDAGLTAFGRRLVERMEEVGLIKCCSHTGYRTALDVFAMSRKPAILSHSNPRALVDHERNVPDEVLRACAGTGGVVGINGIGLFLGADTPNASDVFRHIDYVVQLVGPDHVGIGLDALFPRSSDDDGSLTRERDQNYWPRSKGYNTNPTSLGPEVLPDIIEVMRRNGYGQSAIDGILGGNFARVAAQCWKPEG